MRKRASVEIGGPVWICLALIIVLSFLTESFMSLSNLKNLIRQSSVLALAAFGQTLVILVEGTDLSVGAVMGLTSCSAAVAMVNGGWSPWAAILLAIGVAVVCGLINGFIVSYIGLNPFVATYGMWGIALGIALVITNERFIYGLPEGLSRMHYGEVFGIPIPLLVVVGIGWLLNFALKSTTIGVKIHAIGGNSTSAELSGIPVKACRMMVYAFSGFMAGLAGIMFLSRCNAAQGMDTIGYEFDSIAAVVAGGTSLSGGKGSIGQTVIGVILIAIVRNGLNLLGVNTYLQMVIIGSVLVLAYVFKSRPR